MRKLTLHLFCFIALICISVFSTHAQVKDRDEKAKPFKVLTTGKQISLKGTDKFKTIMVWTSSGHRIVERQNINEKNFQFRVSVPDKIFFLMVKMYDGKTYTEKIGIL